jgi:hypothetical protein
LIDGARGGLGLGEQQQARRRGVEAVKRPERYLASLAPPEQLLGELQRRARFARVSRVRRHAARLVDGEEQFVLVDDSRRIERRGLGRGERLQMADDLGARGDRP